MSILAFLRLANAARGEPEETGFPLVNADLVKELNKAHDDPQLLEAFSRVDRVRFCNSPSAPLRGCYVDMPYRDDLVHLSAPGIYGKRFHL